MTYRPIMAAKARLMSKFCNVIGKVVALGAATVSTARYFIFTSTGDIACRH